MLSGGFVDQGLTNVRVDWDLTGVSRVGPGWFGVVLGVKVDFWVVSLCPCNGIVGYPAEG